MKLFFYSALKMKVVYPDFIDRIFKKLHELPFELIEKQLEKAWIDDMGSWTKEQTIQCAKDSIGAINNSDFCLIEASIPSLEVCNQLYHCVSGNKPSIVLYQGNDVPFMLDQEKYSCVVLAKYDKSNLEEVVESSIKKAIKLVKDKH